MFLNFAALARLPLVDATCSTGLMVDILDRDDTRQFG
jgi:hypothetical protein